MGLIKVAEISIDKLEDRKTVSASMAAGDRLFRKRHMGSSKEAQRQSASLLQSGME